MFYPACRSRHAICRALSSVLSRPARSTNAWRYVATGYAMDQSPGSFIVRPVITDQVSNEDVAVNAEHQRDSCPMGTAFLPFLCRSPARSDTRLFFTRMTTTPSGINVNVILSPALIPRRTRIGLGIFVCPLHVNLASVLIRSPGILTYIIVVRNGCLCKL